MEENKKVPFLSDPYDPPFCVRLFCPETDGAKIRVKHYSFYRIKRILKKFYNCGLQKVYPGYKGNRYPGFKNKYHIYDLETGKIIVQNAKLDVIRYYLSTIGCIGFPLEDEYDDFFYTFVICSLVRFNERLDKGEL